MALPLLGAPVGSATAPKSSPIVPNLPATDKSRATAASYFRPYPSASSDNTTVSCRLPALSWVEERYVLLGVNPTILPPELDLTSPRVGRAIASRLVEEIWGDSRSTVLNLALFCTSPSIPYVPPYPGVPPKDADAPNRTQTSYVDGTRGCWDARRYPQQYNSRRPWLPFLRHVQAYDWDPEKCEYMTPVDYFRWNDPSRPASGGSWGLRRLSALFSAREKAEATFTQLRKDASMLRSRLPFNAANRSELYDVPYYDPLTWDEVADWRTWLDGRDRLAYTLQYVAELKALNLWLWAQMEWTKNKPNQPKVADPSYMGTWGASITATDEWCFLVAFGVPIYVIMKIPDGHPLLSHLVVGNLDGDERYRRNSFDADLDLQPCWAVDRTSAPDDVFPLIPNLQLACERNHLPSFLHHPSPPQRPQNRGSNSCFVSWSSSLYLDTSLRRFDCQAFMDHIARFRARYELLLSFPAVTSNIHILNAEKDRHPLLDVIGPSNEGNQLRKYEEVYDSYENCYYPRRLGRRTAATKDLVDKSSYRWYYQNENILIISEEPFPGRDKSYGRVVNPDDDSSDDDDDIGIRVRKPETPRRYFTADKTGQLPCKFKFIWTPRDPAHSSNHGSAGPLLPPPPLVLNFSTNYVRKARADRQLLRFRNQHQLFLLDNSVTEVAKEYMSSDNRAPQIETTHFFSDYVTDFAAALTRNDSGVVWENLIHHCEQAALRIQFESLGTTQPITDMERQLLAGKMERNARRLEDQRTLLRNQMRRRIFRPMGGDNLISSRPVPWRITGGMSGDVCYPIRISGVHSNATIEKVFAMLLELKFILAVHDVVLYSMYSEIDHSQSVDLGLRYCEDALFIMAVLHGVNVDGRLMEVQFLYALVGKAEVVAYPKPANSYLRRSLKQRFKRIVPFATYPGLSCDLQQHAFTLEGEIKNRLERAREASAAEIQRIRLLERRPPIDMVLNIDSLCDADCWTASQVTVPIAQTAGLNNYGTPDPAPAHDIPLLCSTVMVGEMRWKDPPGKAGRDNAIKGPNAEKNAAKHRKHPEEFKNGLMSSSQRSNLKRAIEHRSETLRTCWRPVELQQLPALVFILSDVASPELSIVDLYTQLWRWQDECLAILRSYRDQDPSPDYDFSPFEAAFSGLSRLEALRGPFYAAVCEALKLYRKGMEPVSSSIQG